MSRTLLKQSDIISSDYLPTTRRVAFQVGYITGGLVVYLVDLGSSEARSKPSLLRKLHASKGLGRLQRSPMNSADLHYLTCSSPYFLHVFLLICAGHIFYSGCYLSNLYMSVTVLFGASIFITICLTILYYLTTNS